MSTATTCPTCGRTLKLPDSLVGQKVQCPGCEATFLAEPDAPEPAPARPAGPPDLPAPASGPSPFAQDAEGDRPTTRRRRERFLCPSCDFEVREGMRRCPECGERLDFGDGDEQDRPWDRPGYQRLDTNPHRGGLILTLGIIGMVVNTCLPIGLFFSVPALIMGQADLRAMKAGRIDISGQGTTQAGMILGIVGTIIGGIYALFFFAFIVLIAMNP